MPAHSLLIQSHLGEAWSKPAIFQVSVKMRCAVRGMEQQTRFSGCVSLQVLCDVRVQINLSFSSSGFEMLDDASGIFLNLLLDGDGATMIGEMTTFHRKHLRNPHTSGSEQHI